MTYALSFNHGDPVIVLDRRGNHEARGVVVGRHQTRQGPRYDVQPHGEPSMANRLVGIPEEHLRRMSITLVKGVA